MELFESDPSLCRICRMVEEKLVNVQALSNFDLSVQLLASFDDEPEAKQLEAITKTPAAYRRSNQTILINGREF
jgi:hypothetical protein